MKKRSFLLLLSGAMIAAIVFAGCAQGSPATSAPTTTTSTGPTTTTSPPSTSPSVAKPQYGGTFTRAQATDVSVFDPAATGEFTSAGGDRGLVNEQFLFSDWTQGPAGSGKVDFPESSSGIDTFGPGLATSWTATNPQTFVLQIRQGVHWALNPDSPASVLVGGREMTADDVVNCFNYMVHTPGSALQINEPDLVKVATIKKTGPWEVTISVPSDSVNPLMSWLWLVQGGGFFFMLPTDVVQKYGSMSDWHNVVGTGPYMLTDLVADSEVTFKRNPNYWMTDPTGPGKGNKLPYMDEVKELILPDISTQQAALRTAKIDTLDAVTTDDAKSLNKTTPALLSHRYFGTYQYDVSMRTDKPDQPFHDVRVRQALMMATDFKGMAQILYGGDALIYNFPAMEGAFPDQFYPMEQLPQSVQALYQYNPDQAKKLLADAGYPQGFKTTMIVASDTASVDAASTYKAMWEKVGIDVTLKPEEFGVWISQVFSRQYDQMMYRNSLDTWVLNLTLDRFYDIGFEDASYVDEPSNPDPTIEAARLEINKNLFVDFAKANQVLRDLTPYVLGQAYYIPRPDPATYNFYWPWVNNYYGQGTGLLSFIQYQWIDQNLKKSLGH